MPRVILTSFFGALPRSSTTIPATSKFDNRSRPCRPNSVIRGRRLVHGQEGTARVARMKLLNALCGVLGWRKEAVMPVESCIPIIPSANLEKSLRLWVDGLGFSMSSEMRKDDKLIFCMLRKENLCFMLNQRAGTRSSRKTTRAFDCTGAEGYTQNQRAIEEPWIQCFRPRTSRLRAGRVFPYRRRRLCALLRRPYTEIGISISRPQSRTANQKGQHGSVSAVTPSSSRVPAVC
jgi:hypothetical protein